MENIINKLNSTKVNSKEKFWFNWTLEEEKQILELYLIFSKKESHIFDLIYRNHHCDSWEDIFRDYNPRYLEDKKVGVEVAIEYLDEHSQNETEYSDLCSSDSNTSDIFQEDIIS